MRKYLSFAEFMALVDAINPDTEVVGWMARGMPNTFYKVFVRIAADAPWICVEASFAHTMEGPPARWQRDTPPSGRVVEVHGAPSLLGCFKPMASVGDYLETVFERGAAVSRKRPAPEAARSA